VERDSDQEETSARILDELQGLLATDLPGAQVCSLEWLFQPFAGKDGADRVLTRLEEVLTGQAGPDKLSGQGTYSAKVNTVIARLLSRVIHRWKAPLVRDLLMLLMCWRKALNEEYAQFEPTFRPKLEYCE
jgi:hypothetical protein